MTCPCFDQAFFVHTTSNDGQVLCFFASPFSLVSPARMETLFLIT